MPCQNAAVVFRAGVQLHVTRQLGETTITWGSGGQHKCLYFFEVASYWPFSTGVTTTKCFIETLREGHCISQHTLSFQMSTPAPCHFSLLSPHCVRFFPSLNIKHQSEPSCTFESGMKRSGGSFWGRFAYQFFFIYFCYSAQSGLCCCWTTSLPVFGFNWLFAFTLWASKTRVRLNRDLRTRVWMSLVSLVPFANSKDTVISEMRSVYASRSSLHPTLALMMVGLGSKMPCIFLKAGMTKRLQVTTADTGFPRTSTGTEGRRDKEEKAHEKTALHEQKNKSVFLSTLHTTWEGKD